MVRKSYTPEQILNKLREAEILLNQGTTLPVVWKKIGVSDCTYAIHQSPKTRFPGGDPLNLPAATLARVRPCDSRRVLRKPPCVTGSLYTSCCCGLLLSRF